MEEIATPADEPHFAAEGTPPAAEARAPVRAYDPAVLSERQPRITDLVPVRPLAVVAVFLSCVLGLALVVGLHVVTREARQGPLGPMLAPLDLAQPASVASWLAAIWLWAAAGLAILIYRIRVHRADDYQGRYRVWLWAAAALAWLSLDTVAALHVPLGWLLVRVGGTAPALAGAGAQWAWMSLYGVVFGAVGLRLALELRPSVVSLGMLALAAGLYLAAATCGMGWLTSGRPDHDALLVSSLPLVAHGLLLGTMLWYARHVYLDAAGRLLVRIEANPPAAGKKRRLGRWGRGSEAQPGAENVAGDAAALSPRGGAADTAPPSRPAMVRPATEANSARGPVPEDVAADDEAEAAEAPLSRSERRRLKRLGRDGQQRRAA
jgi:hypothetical protein